MKDLGNFIFSMDENSWDPLAESLANAESPRAGNFQISRDDYTDPNGLKIPIKVESTEEQERKIKAMQSILKNFHKGYLSRLKSGFRCILDELARLARDVERGESPPEFAQED